MTLKERQCLNLIRALTVDGVAPSYDAIAAGLGLKSKSGVHRLIESLERQGRVVRDPRRARSLRIVGKPLDQAVADLIALHGLEAVEHALQAHHRSAA